MEGLNGLVIDCEVLRDSVGQRSRYVAVLVKYDREFPVNVF